MITEDFEVGKEYCLKWIEERGYKHMELLTDGTTNIFSKNGKRAVFVKYGDMFIYEKTVDLGIEHVFQE